MTQGKYSADDHLHALIRCKSLYSIFRQAEESAKEALHIPEDNSIRSALGSFGEKLVNTADKRRLPAVGSIGKALVGVADKQEHVLRDIEGPSIRIEDDRDRSIPGLIGEPTGVREPAAMSPINTPSPRRNFISSYITEPLIGTMENRRHSLVGSIGDVAFTG